MGSTTFATVEHKHHRLRRSALNPYFSKQMINRLEPMIQSIVNRLYKRLEEFRATEKPVEMRAAYSALTIDVITTYCFNESWGHLEDPNFKRDWFEGVHTMLIAGNFMKHYPWMFKAVRVFPQSFISWLSPMLGGVFMYENVSPTPCVEGGN
jgi:cytochrome P450